jgi:hypothetical protein
MMVIGLVMLALSRVKPKKIKAYAQFVKSL